MKLEQPDDAFEADLKAYLDGELSLLRRLQLRAHLARCPKCQEELKIMQTIETELKEEETAPLGTDLRAKILENAPVETPKLAPKGNRRRLALDYAFVLVPACFLVLLIFSVMGNRVKNTFNSAAAQVGNLSLDSGGEAAKRASGESATSGSFADRAAPAPPSAASPMDNPIFGMQKAQQSPSDQFSSRRRATDFDVVPAQRAVHKEGSISVAVDDAEAQSNATEVLVKNLGGFVANNALSTGNDGRKSATLDVRIPVDKFEDVVGKIGKLGKVQQKSVNGEDITQRVTLAGAQRESLARELSIREAQLRAADPKKAAAKAQIVADVRGLRFQANQARAQLEYLKKYAALATLFVTLQDKPKTVAPASFSGSLGQTGNEAWKSFLSSARLPLQLIIWILAYSPLWIPFLIVWRKWGRKWMSTT